MKSGLSEIVHIIPLGQEFDRAVRPFDSAAANHIYIIADENTEVDLKNPMMYMAESCPPSEYYVSNVVKYLKKKHIPTDIVRTDFSDMSELLKTISSLIRKEQFFGNKVYVNMSAAGELAAAAAALAGMALDAEVYCVHTDGYASDAERPKSGVSVCSTNAVSMLPKVDIHLPDDSELPVLEELYYTNNNILSASEISDVLENDNSDDCVMGKLEEPIMKCVSMSESRPVYKSSQLAVDRTILYDSEEESDVKRWERRKTQSRNLMKVSGMMKRMEEKGYVTKAKFGRKMMYQLTERGMYALILSGVIE